MRGGRAVLHHFQQFLLLCILSTCHDMYMYCVCACAHDVCAILSIRHKGFTQNKLNGITKNWTRRAKSAHNMATQLRVTAKAGDGGREREGGREETRDNCVEVSKCNIINTHTSEATKMLPQKPVDTLSTRQALG